MPHLPGRKIYTKDATAATVPTLLVGQHHMESSALHSLYFPSRLSRWSTFLRAVEATSKSQTLSSRTQRLDDEAVELGDEHGLQGHYRGAESSWIEQHRRRTQAITRPTDELSLFMTQQDIDYGHEPGSAAAKFLCHPKDDPRKLAYIRIYRQIRICGFEFAPSSIRASHAIKKETITELVAFKTLKELACPAVPQLLGYQAGTQGEHEIPGGKFRESLSQDYFWSLNEQQRGSIREEFRRVYQQLLGCGVKPCMATTSKLIYDESTGKMHISGFRMAALECDTNQQFRRTDYVMYGLAKRSDRTDWYDDDSAWKW
ncbi:uncharacterized protein N7515_004033 [Penicillium bovifimosum]|uniref:Uncharacterized protein n=1 Tax=Penicillium bovifimosum TaxID=126998 RepID=A0A9W9L6S8_9EURO|nr:uncharacterized protein N7515_004033 [Penicillium bovifimosum]KAJ5139185.1 hypothetical protein N7515_004033 [Penicillium bovifimosum]